MSHRDYQLALFRQMLARAGQKPWLSRPAGRPALVSSNISRLDTHNKHWLGQGTKPWCCVCSARGMTQRVKSKCIKRVNTLCMDWYCFMTIIRQKTRTSFRPSYIQIVETSNTMSVQESRYSQHFKGVPRNVRFLSHRVPFISEIYPA
jgi:hypothetical protein